ncbi:MAG: aminotransferase class III-fold pyridoxal phosphate-dependent enzyme [Anaerolineae bacterium]|nr:aminotransferase class III-fold pyridoxal phosphate-dependent enzyme [Anaerolineae bacterium]
MTFAKLVAWGNGAPIGCTIATPEIADAVKGATFSTFGGNPVTMATALATIEYIEENNLKDNASVQGAKLREKLEEFQAEFPFIGEVRGMGLMQAMEIIEPNTKTPDYKMAVALMDTAKEQGLLLGKGGLYNNVIRISPHLNVSDDDMNMAFDMLAKALLEVSS